MADHRPYPERTRAELYDRAKALEIPGRSSMNKQELIDALRKTEGSTARAGSTKRASASSADADASPKKGKGKKWVIGAAGAAAAVVGGVAISKKTDLLSR